MTNSSKISLNKSALGSLIASRLSSGDIIGLGSGSTVECAIREIGRRVYYEGLKVFGIPTSLQTAHIAASCGIVVLSPFTDVELSWAFDGADEVDSSLSLIKGGGAAMLGEKLIANRARGKFTIIVTRDKLVSRLGENSAVPIEVIPAAFHEVCKELKKLGFSEVTPRICPGKYGPIITEHGHIVVDAKFDSVIPEDMEMRIKQVVGVVESGLFIGYASEVLVADDSGIERL